MHKHDRGIRVDGKKSSALISFHIAKNLFLSIGRLKREQNLGQFFNSLSSIQKKSSFYFHAFTIVIKLIEQIYYYSLKIIGVEVLGEVYMGGSITL